MIQDGIQPHECLYDLTERGSFTHVFTNCGLDLQDPIAVRFGSERKWRFTHVKCLINVPFRFPRGIDLLWAKWGLTDLAGLEAYASEPYYHSSITLLSNNIILDEEDIEAPCWPDPEEIWAARMSGYHSI